LKYKSIDRARSELRFFLILPFLGYFLDKMGEKFEKKIFSGNEIVQTIYLGNSEQIVPGGTSLKARRYLSQFSERIALAPEDAFLFETKTHKDSACWHAREKAPREKCSLGEIITAASSRYEINLEPYVLVEYRRRHFLPNQEDIPLRITIDTGMCYWLIEKDGSHLMLADSEIARIECKVEHEYLKHPLFISVLELLHSLGAQPIISKKDEAYNLLKKHFDTSCARPLVKELTECEIEAKLILRDSDPVGFFRKLKSELEGENIAIGMDSHYPFTFTTSSLNHYWSRRENDRLMDGLKILFKGVVFKPVAKDSLTIIDTDLAIVKRREKKGRKVKYTPEILQSVVGFFADQLGPLEYAGYLSRSRRAIWPEHRDTKRFYHVSLDRCLTSDRFPLYQLEIEYSGILKEKVGILMKSSRDAEDEIIRDTQFLARYILDFAKKSGVALESNSLSKFEWLIKSN
jgi:hypothetical protein